MPDINADRDMDGGSCSRVRLYQEKSYEVDFEEERGGVNEPLDEESTQEK